MRIHKFLRAVVAMLLFGALLAACGGAPPAQIAATAQSAAGSIAGTAQAVAPTVEAAAATAVTQLTGTPDKLTLQLKWVTQGQFAGYYAAIEQGYYKDENLDVTIRPG